MALSRYTELEKPSFCQKLGAHVKNECSRSHRGLPPHLSGDSSPPAYRWIKGEGGYDYVEAYALEIPLPLLAGGLRGALRALHLLFI